MKSRSPLAVFPARAAAVLPWAAFLAFGFAILPRPLPAAPRGLALAWLSALLVVCWLAAHLTLRLHGQGRLSRDLGHELRFRLLGTPAVRGPREPRRPWAPGWYGGRSRSGGRPRFD